MIDPSSSSSPEKRPLTIWLFNPYGPLPDEGWREYSYVTIGSALAASGHEVIWWTSNFSHHFKTHRSEGWEDRRLPSGLTIRLVPTPGYRRNISPGRFLRDAVFGWRAWRYAAKLAKPDVILTSEPATMGGFAGPRIARKANIPLIYDQMDLWPELMVQALPTVLRPLGHLAFWPVYRCRRAIFRRLDGAMALARPYLASITDEIDTRQQPPKLIVYNGIDVPAFRSTMEQPLPQDLAVFLDRPGLKAIFAGSLGPSYDIGPMIEAAKALANADSEITLYIAGDGPERATVEAAACSCDRLIYLGKLPPDLLPRVYARCDIGLSCYSATSNVEMCDKFYDYTAAGLVVVNSLNGEVRDWIDTANLGLQYQAGDPASLTAALKTIAANPDKAEQWRTASWQIGMTFDKTVQHLPLAEWIETIVSAKTNPASHPFNRSAASQSRIASVSK